MASHNHSRPIHVPFDTPVAATMTTDPEFLQGDTAAFRCACCTCWAAVNGHEDSITRCIWLAVDLRTITARRRAKREYELLSLESSRARPYDGCLKYLSLVGIPEHVVWLPVALSGRAGSSIEIEAFA